VRGLFDPEAINRAHDRAVAVAAAFDAKIARGDTAGYEEFFSGAYEAGHIPQADLDIPLTVREVIQSGGYDELMAPLFGAASHGFAARRSFMKGVPVPLGFHQDAFFTEYSYNCWTPLNEAGITSANLEVIVGFGEPLFPHAAIVDSTLTDRVLRQCIESKRFWHPILSPGDALVFSTFMMHRTYQTPAMTDERYSLEIRGPITTDIRIAGVPPDPGSAKTLDSIEKLPLFLQKSSYSPGELLRN
jgi:hypothetical protein